MNTQHQPGPAQPSPGQAPAPTHQFPQQPQAQQFAQQQPQHQQPTQPPQAPGALTNVIQQAMAGLIAQPQQPPQVQPPAQQVQQQPQALQHPAPAPQPPQPQQAGIQGVIQQALAALIQPQQPPQQQAAPAAPPAPAPQQQWPQAPPQQPAPQFPQQRTQQFPQQPPQQLPQQQSGQQPPAQLPPNLSQVTQALKTALVQSVVPELRDPRFAQFAPDVQLTPDLKGLTPESVNAVQQWRMANPGFFQAGALGNTPTSAAGMSVEALDQGTMQALNMFNIDPQRTQQVLSKSPLAGVIGWAPEMRAPFGG